MFLKRVLCAVALLGVVSAAVAQDGGPTPAPIPLSIVAARAHAAGNLAGYEDRTFILEPGKSARAVIRVKSPHPQLYFNVTKDGADSAIFIGSRDGDTFEGALEGRYIVSVYLMRAAARRGEKAAFDLTVEIK